jgi:hypothetical protein
MMSAAIVAGEPGAVDGENDRQLLQANIVQDLIEGAL